ncbi:hypothetical protein CHUAL_000055 [Chamberlinius hualienensis]
MVFVFLNDNIIVNVNHLQYQLGTKFGVTGKNNSKIYKINKIDAYSNLLLRFSLSVSSLGPSAADKPLGPYFSCNCQTILE